MANARLPAWHLLAALAPGLASDAVRCWGVGRRFSGLRVAGALLHVRWACTFASRSGGLLLQCAVWRVTSGLGGGRELVSMRLGM